MTGDSADSGGLAERHNLEILYRRPLAATRTGPLYNAFSYPTKISPETIALFIASHTDPGDTILDPFAGSGTTGVASLLCSNPSAELRSTAERLNLPVRWGPRNAVLYEVSTIGSFVADTLCHPPSASAFLDQAIRWIDLCEQRFPLYRAFDDRGTEAEIRHAIWTDFIVCPYCAQEASVWDVAVQLEPTVAISTDVKCPTCKWVFSLNEASRVTEESWDPVLQQRIVQRKRRLAYIYGQTKSRTWSRPPTLDDEKRFLTSLNAETPSSVPIEPIRWGDLHRSGYHYGITHAHHFYTRRNLVVMGELWCSINEFPDEVRASLKMLALSYNTTHSTLMTRVVAKHGQRNFVITGAQSGVLYISSIPVEKNIYHGLRRKASVMAKAFEIVRRCPGSVEVYNLSSTELRLADRSVDYVFTDPPFGDFIPYSEVNYLNEAWLGSLTDQTEEAIISRAQRKNTTDYADLIGTVFGEVSRVLKSDGRATVAFHAARAEVWEALRRSCTEAGLAIELASVLDKVQPSFKQVVSAVSVQGDPLFLLRKTRVNGHRASDDFSPAQVLERLVLTATDSNEPAELTVERLYSRFIVYYLASDVPVPLDAAAFYRLAETRLRRQG